MSSITFAVDSNQITVKSVENSSFLELEMYCLSDAFPNRNDCAFTKDGMVASIPTVYNKPILGYFSPVTKDFEEHNHDIKFDPDTGKIYQDFQGRDGEKAIGLIRESDTVEVVEKDGLNWLHITCGIWAKYNAQQVKHILTSKRKKVSVECNVVRNHFEGKIEVIDEFIFNGVTILGNRRGGFIPVNEGIAGAHLKLLEFANSEQCNTSMKAMSFAAKVDLEEQGLTSISEKLMRSLGVNFFVEDVYLDGVALLQEHDTGRLFTTNYSIDGDNVNIYLKDKHYVSESDLPGIESNRKLFIEKSKIGKGPEIPIDFSKEAVSDAPWGSISKTDLRNKILASINYRTLVGKAYLVVLDGWEDAPSSNLKYPIAQIKGGKLVINSDALSVAYSFLQKNTGAPYYRKAIKRLNSLKRIAGMETDNKKNFTEEKKVMKNKFIGMPSEFKYMRSAGGRALFAKEGKIFSAPCDAGEGEEVEFREDSLMTANLFVKECSIAEGDAEGDEVDVTEALMSFISEQDEVKCSMDKMMAEKDIAMAEKDVAMAAKDEEIRMAKECAEKATGDLEMARKDLEMAKAEVAKAGKVVMVEKVKDLASKEVLLSEKDRFDIIEMAEHGDFDSTKACEQEIAMRVYSAIKREPLSYQLPKNSEVVKTDESKLQTARRLIDKK
jgi:hypothetical protein